MVTATDEPATALLAACGGVHLQSASHPTNELNKSVQTQAERQCDQFGGQQRIDCQRQIGAQYEAQRLKDTASVP